MQDTTAGLALGIDACPLLLTVDEENPVEYDANDLRSMEMGALVPLYRVRHLLAISSYQTPPNNGFSAAIPCIQQPSGCLYTPHHLVLATL